MRTEPIEVVLLDGRRVSLRTPGESDAGKMLHYLREAHAASWRSLNGPPTRYDEMSEAEEADILQRAAESPDCIMLVAVIDDTIIGSINIVRIGKFSLHHCGQLGMLVHPSYRRLGIGETLLRHALGCGELLLEIWNVRLTVRTFNTGAIALYEKQGFRRVGVLRAVSDLDGTFFDEYEYQRIGCSVFGCGDVPAEGGVELRVDFSALDAVIFDMDGVIVDSEPLWLIAEQEVLCGVGFPLSCELCLETQGLRVDDVVAYWVRRFPEVAADVHGLSTQIVDRLIELVEERGAAKMGLFAALDGLREMGIPLALASSSPRRVIDVVLDKLGIAERFVVVKSAEDETWGKPHPAVFLATAERLGASPARCLVIEDSVNGVIAARAAQMRVVAVPEEGVRDRPEFSLSEGVLGNLGQLIRTD